MYKFRANKIRKVKFCFLKQRWFKKKKRKEKQRWFYCFLSIKVLCIYCKIFQNSIEKKTDITRHSYLIHINNLVNVLQST